MKNYSICFLIILFVAVAGCKQLPPEMVDGVSSLTIVSIAEKSISKDSVQLIPLPNASVFILSEYGIQIKKTDENGVLYLANLPSATYHVSVKAVNPEDPNLIYVGNSEPISVSCENVCDTIVTKSICSFGISINEVYSAGPVNNVFYFYDQFIELYNSSDSVKYLDGMLIARISGNNDTDKKGPGADEDDDNDIDGVTYLFKFPGKPGEKNHPFNPKQFVVLACDAANHTKMVSSSIDLSGADWEFFNQYSSADLDNPNSKNLLNMCPDKTSDFLISLVGDVLVVTTGTDTLWEDGLDISTIIDGFEGQSSSTQQKTLDVRIEKSYTLAPPKYSGKSTQRREPGQDTNNGLLDWEIIPAPTPGYQ